MCLSTTWIPRKLRLGFSGWEGSDTQVSDFQLFVFRLTFLTCLKGNALFCLLSGRDTYQW